MKSEAENDVKKIRLGSGRGRWCIFRRGIDTTGLFAERRQKI
jgi:hypothetical protein